jgi:hypothetical protein
LLPVARAAEAFLRGDALADLRDHHPFMTVSDLAFAHEAGTEVEAQWQLMMAHPRIPVRRLVLAAAEQPALRMLFPYTSLLSLCFSRCTGYPYTGDLPMIEPFVTGPGLPPGPPGRPYTWDLALMGAAGVVVYRVWPPGRHPLSDEPGQPLADGVDAREAVAAVVAALPENCGPAIAGTAEDLSR